jgi:GntR family transcriptional regulator
MTIDKEVSRSGAAGPDGAEPSRISFRLDPGSGVPTYLQLVQQVEQALQLGYLARGDQLPRVKDVVGSLAINPNTVLKAYRELEHRGIAAGRPGQGTFVEAAPDVVPLAELSGLRKSLLAWLGTADAAGLDADGMAALFTAALRDFHERRAATGAPRGTLGPASRGPSGPALRGRAAGERRETA